MKRIAIVTISHGNNYGNKLQNYAMQEVYKKMGVNAETIAFSPTIDTSKFTVSRNLVKRIYNKIKNKIEKIKYKDVTKKRIENFEIFNRLIAFSKLYTEDTYEEINGLYEYYSVGSDQVWNPCFHDFSQLYLLKNIKSKNKFSYAASFGIDELPENYIEIFKSNLRDFKYISCRETTGVTIVNDILGLDAVEVIDPTFLLTQEEWDKVSKKPEQLKSNKYILNYFLGNLSDNRRNEIQRIAKENDCEVINILDKNSPFYQTGPSEFLYLEKNAFLICTDSFHSCVFAILYNRPFIVFDREENIVSMNSRIETLINKFELKNRKFEGKITESNLNHDYTEAYEILEKEREKANNFLKKALDIKE